MAFTSAPVRAELISQGISKLPCEMLIKIFKYSKPSCTILDQICKQWRKIMHENRTLWTRVCLLNPDLAEDTLSISHPLAVSVYASRQPSRMSALAEQEPMLSGQSVNFKATKLALRNLSRVRELVLDDATFRAVDNILRGRPAPNLQALDFQLQVPDAIHDPSARFKLFTRIRNLRPLSSTLFGGRLPALRHFAASACKICNPSASPFLLAPLRSLNLECAFMWIKISDMVDVLNRIPTLEHLTLIDTVPFREEMQPELQARLPNLQTLVIDSPLEYVAASALSFNIPSTCTIRLVFRSSSRAIEGCFVAFFPLFLSAASRAGQVFDRLIVSRDASEGDPYASDPSMVVRLTAVKDTTRDAATLLPPRVEFVFFHSGGDAMAVLAPLLHYLSPVFKDVPRLFWHHQGVTSPWWDTLNFPRVKEFVTSGALNARALLYYLANRRPYVQEMIEMALDTMGMEAVVKTLLSCFAIPSAPRTADVDRNYNALARLMDQDFLPSLQRVVLQDIEIDPSSIVGGEERGLVQESDDFFIPANALLLALRGRRGYGLGFHVSFMRCNITRELVESMRTIHGLEGLGYYGGVGGNVEWDGDEKGLKEKGERLLSYDWFERGEEPRSRG
ncbi:hypothetical protein OF83DRAFT_592141 [Amylostereum chailletii]|nr:hypothetical protein OF83DRAFT_592141 [Amylostereum chailletii]